MADFKKLSAVDMVKIASDSANVLIEDYGVIKKMPKDEIGINANKLDVVDTISKSANILIEEDGVVKKVFKDYIINKSTPDLVITERGPFIPGYGDGNTVVANFKESQQEFVNKLRSGEEVSVVYDYICTFGEDEVFGRWRQPNCAVYAYYDNSIFMHTLGVVEDEGSVRLRLRVDISPDGVCESYSEPV